MRWGALGHRDFLILWSASFVSNVGTWIQIVTQSWLLYVLTDSPAYLGLSGLARALPLLAFPLLAGVIADRMRRVRILFFTQWSSMTIATLFAALVFLDWIQPWHILAFAFVGGTVHAFDQPARNALLPDLVPPQDLMSGISLSSWAFNGASLVGPALAGLALPFIGISGCIALNALSYVAIIAALFAIRPAERVVSIGSARQNLIEGARFVRGNATVLWLVVIVFTVGLFGRGYAQMFPVFARDSLGMQASGMSMLYTATGLGACIGALWLALVHTVRRKGVAIWVSGSVFAVGIAAFAYTASLPLAIGLAFVLGIATIVLSTLLTTGLQLNTPPELRGRVMSVYTLSWVGMEHMSLLLMGVAASVWGASIVVACAGLVILVIVSAVALGRREIRTLR